MFKKLREAIFPSKEAKEAAKKREEKRKNAIKDAAQHKTTQLEIKEDRQGRQYEVAAIVDPSLNRDYVQALNWDGLERIGSEKWVKAKADRGEQYLGFVAQKKVELDNKQWEMLLHHVVVEVFALQKAGRDVDEVCHARQEGSSNWIYTKGARITQSVNGGITIDFAQADDEQQLLQAIQDAKTERHLQPEENTFVEGQGSNIQQLAREVEGAVSGDALAEESAQRPFLPPAWMDIKLNDPHLKLAVLKRILQLTGKRLSDPVIGASSTLADLYVSFKAKDKPKKLAQTPQMQRLKDEVPNVIVYSRRQTIIHKEKRIGRWKLIEAELLQRDLPVPGSRGQHSVNQAR